MTRAVIAEPGAAGLAFEFRRDRGQHLFHACIGRLSAAGHDRRAVAGALFAAGNTHAHEGWVVRRRRDGAAHRIAEIGVAGVDQDVVGRQQRPQRRDLLVDRIARRDHDDDGARPANGGGEFRERPARNDAVGKRTRAGMEFLGRLRGAIIDRDGEALFGDVERQIGAHDAKTDQADFRCRHMVTSCVEEGWLGPEYGRKSPPVKPLARFPWRRTERKSPALY